MKFVVTLAGPLPPSPHQFRLSIYTQVHIVGTHLKIERIQMYQNQRCGEYFLSTNKRTSVCLSLISLFVKNARLHEIFITFLCTWRITEQQIETLSASTHSHSARELMFSFPVAFRKDCRSFLMYIIYNMYDMYAQQTPRVFFLCVT